MLDPVYLRGFDPTVSPDEAKQLSGINRDMYDKVYLRALDSLKKRPDPVVFPYVKVPILSFIGVGAFSLLVVSVAKWVASQRWRMRAPGEILHVSRPFDGALVGIRYRYWIGGLPGEQDAVSLEGTAVRVGSPLHQLLGLDYFPLWGKQSFEVGHTPVVYVSQYAPQSSALSTEPPFLSWCALLGTSLLSIGLARRFTARFYRAWEWDQRRLKGQWPFNDENIQAYTPPKYRALQAVERQRLLQQGAKVGDSAENAERYRLIAETASEQRQVEAAQRGGQAFPPRKMP